MNCQYATIGQGQTDQVLGAADGTRRFLSHIIIQPSATEAGAVTVKDGSITVFSFAPGTLADLRPIIVPFGAGSVNGSWKISTGANVSVMAVGMFA